MKLEVKLIRSQGWLQMCLAWLAGKIYGDFVGWRMASGKAKVLLMVKGLCCGQNCGSLACLTVASNK